jgi:hypothetical protein
MIDQKQPENGEYFNCLGSMITNDARCTGENTSRIANATAVFKKKMILCHQQTGIKFKFDRDKKNSCTPEDEQISDVRSSW